MKPDWLPDWKDESAYPDPQNTIPRQWAWEFLRRNEDYQNLCDEMGEEYFEELREHFFYLLENSKLDYETLTKESHLSEPHFSVLFSIANQADNLTPPSTKFIHKRKKWSKLFNKVCNDFGLEIPDHPKYTKTIVLFQIESLIRPFDIGFNVDNLTKHKQIDFRILPRNDSKALVTFNLNKPLTPQFKEAKESIVAYKAFIKERRKIGKITQRKRNKQYRNYLRVLDAKNSNVKTRKIDIMSDR